MARAPTIWTDAVLKYVHTAYVHQQVPPSQVLKDINRKFGTDYKIKQLYNLVDDRGWRQKRQRVRDKSLVPAASVGRMVADRKRQIAAVTQEFSDKSQSAARKAFGMLEQARTARELSALASAASTMVKTFRLCEGLDDEPTAKSITFNYNFAAVATPTQSRTVDVSTTEHSASDNLSTPITAGAQDQSQ